MKKKTLELTDRQSAALERTLLGLLEFFGTKNDPEEILEHADVFLQRSERDRETLKRVWWKLAKMEGKA